MSGPVPPVLPGATLGVMGGGQLGRMFVHAAQRLGYFTAVLDADPQSPAGRVSHHHIQTDYSDPSGLAQLAALCAAVTTEFENVPADALQTLAAGDVEGALAKLQHAVQTDPENDDARFDLVKLLLELDQDDEAKVAFAPVIAKCATVRRLDSLNRWMQARDAQAMVVDPQARATELQANIAANKRDFESRFTLAQLLLARAQAQDPMHLQRHRERVVHHHTVEAFGRRFAQAIDDEVALAHG